MSDAPLLEVTGLCKKFALRRGLLGGAQGWLHAVEDVSFSIAAGETLALVGESGCGKTTTGRSVLRLLEPDAGRIVFDAQDVRALPPRRLQRLRRDMQIVFQDPYASLNPRMTVGAIVGEALRVHGIAHGSELHDRVATVLRRVGLSPDYRHRYPHEFSGGQRQRIGIARALALEPRFIVCDEAVSALDISIQAQIINLLRELQDEYRLAYLFITHDLNVVRHLAHRIAVMYLGRIVETAPAPALFEAPLHPYSAALLAANPTPDPRVPRRAPVLSGDVPSPLSPPSGCAFHPRCPEAMPVCTTQRPAPQDLGQARQASCHLHRRDAPAALRDAGSNG